MRTADQTPVLDSCDLGFCWKNRSVRGKFRFFPALPKYVVKPTAQKRIRTSALRKQPFKRKNRLSAVPTDQAERIVARPHHAYYFKRELARPSIQYRQALESVFNPFLGQPFIKAIVSERWSPSRPIPTCSPFNRQSNPIVNRKEGLCHHWGSLNKERRPSQEG